MRITDVSIYSGSIETVSFSLVSSDPSARYMVRDMLGLDAEELVPRFYSFGLQSGAKFYDFVMKARTIVIRFTLNPNFSFGESYSDIRDTLYKSISSARNGLVTLNFNSSGATAAKIMGFITKFEVPYFTPLPEVQITIRCDDPIFRAINPVHYKSTDLKTTNPIQIADSISSAPHGFEFQATFKAASPALTIQDQASNPDWYFKVIPTGGFLSGDVLTMSSEYSIKKLYYVRGGVTTYLVDKLDTKSVWPIVFPGVNNLYFLEIANFNWNYLEYYPAFWGV